MKNGIRTEGSYRRSEHLCPMKRKVRVKTSSTILAGGVRFATVQECLDFLPEEERALTEHLRSFILGEVPELKERLSFNVPFYKGHRDVCFLWPASVLWGQRKTYSGVRLGFSYGAMLSDPSGYLQRGTRKQVHWHDLQALTPGDERVIARLLAQAIALDRERAAGLG